MKLEFLEGRLPPVCAGRRLGTAQGASSGRAPAACAQPARGRQDAFQTLLSRTPIWKVTSTCSAAEQSGNQSIMKSGFVKRHLPQPGAVCSLWVRGWSGPQPRRPPSSAGGGTNKSSPRLSWDPRDHLRSPSGRSRQWDSGPAATGERRKYQPRPSLHPRSLGVRLSPGNGDMHVFFMYVYLT